MKRCTAILLFFLISVLSSSNASAEILKIGIYAETPSFAYVTSAGIADQYDGLDIAIIKAIADDLGMELKLENMQFDSLLIALKTGKIDAAISAITITKERARSVNFSYPYFTTKQTMIVHIDSPIRKASDLKGKRIAVGLGTTAEIAVKKLGFPYNIFQSGPEILRELKNGKCDAVVIEAAIARRMSFRIKWVKMVNDDEAFAPEHYAIAVNKKKQQLLDKINASIKKLQENGTIDSFVKKYCY